MRLRLSLLLSLLVGALLLASSPLPRTLAQDPGKDSRNQKLTLDVRDAEIGDTLRLISRAFDLNIVFAPEVKGSVTVSFREVGLEEALDAIVRVTGFRWRHKGAIIEVYKSSEAAEPSETRVFELTRVMADDVREIIEGTVGKESLVQTRGHIFVVRAPLATLDKLEKLLPSLDRADLARRPPEVRAFQLHYIDGKSAEESVKGFLSHEGSSIHYEPSSNTLVVEDTAARLAAVADYLRETDRRVPQVRIEAQIVETSMTDTERLGFDWNAVASANGMILPSSFPFESLNHRLPFVPGSGHGGLVGNNGFTFFGSQGNGSFQFGKFDFSQLSLAIDLVLKSGKGKLVASPQITTVNNRLASIRVGQSIPIQTFTQNLQYGINAYTGFTTIDVGTKLEVTPRVSGNGEIELIVKPEVSEVTQYVTGPLGQQLPVVGRRTTETEVILKSGETLMIGGLLREETANNGTEVPFLGDIPVVGELFKWQGKDKTKTDLLVFLTPRILEVDPPEETVQLRGRPVRASVAQKIESALLLLKDVSPERRAQGVRLLVAIPSADADPVIDRAALLGEIAEKDPISIVVREAFRGLSKVDPGALAQLFVRVRMAGLRFDSADLVAFALEEPSPPLAAGAIVAALEVEGPSAPKALVAALRSPDARTRRAALALLPFTTGPEERDALFLELGNARGLEAVEAIDALAALRLQDALPALADKVLTDPDPHVRGHAFFALATIAPHEGIALVTTAVGVEGTSRRLTDARVTLGVTGGMSPPPAREALVEALRRVLGRPVTAPTIAASDADLRARIERALAILRERAPSLWYLVAAAVEEVRLGDGPPFYGTSAATITLSRVEVSSATTEAIAGDLVHGATHLYLRGLGQRSNGHLGEEVALAVEARALARLCGAPGVDMAAEDEHVSRVLRTRFWLAADAEGRPW